MTTASAQVRAGIGSTPAQTCITRSRHCTAGHWATAGAGSGRCQPSFEQAGKVRRQRHVSKLRRRSDRGAGLLPVGLLLAVDLTQAPVSGDLLGRALLSDGGAQFGSSSGRALVVGPGDGDAGGEAHQADGNG